MSSTRHLVEFERWPIAHSESGWKSPVPILSRARKSPWTESRRRVLKDTVEREIVPRLMLGHYSSSDILPISSETLAGDLPRPSAWEIAEMVRLVSGESVSLSLAHVRRIRARGVSIAEIFLNLLTPAARLLGERWVDDTADFATVTIATSRLQQILRELALDFQADARVSRRSPQALLAAMPGDQHTFGVSMLQEFFRRDGWAVCGDIPNCRQDLVDIAGSAPFRLIGISASCDTAPDDLKSFIKNLRRATADPRCQIVVGGRLFLAQPDLARVVGADGMATDAQTATRQLSSLLDTKAV